MEKYIIEKQHDGYEIRELPKALNIDNCVLAYSLNNKIVHYKEKVHEGDVVSFHDTNSKMGYLIYQKSIYFLLVNAVNTLFPGNRLEISYSVSKASYCFFHNKNIHLNEERVKLIENKMHELIKEKIPIDYEMVNVKEADNNFINFCGCQEKQFYKDYFPDEIPLYQLNSFEYKDYYFAPLVENTSKIKNFKLKFFMPGFIIQFATRNDENVLFNFKEIPKYFHTISEASKWGKFLGINFASSLNRRIKENKTKEIVLVSESLQEKQLNEVADKISSNREKYMLVQIAGPSSSGKTTFSKKLETALKVNGLEPILISMDDYFLDKERTPKDENGEYDFENIGAIDIERFQSDIEKLIYGEVATPPFFDFTCGKSKLGKKTLRKGINSPIIIEGIHGLNPLITSNVPRHLKYIIYVSSLTPLNLDSYNHIRSTETRLLRRIVRDGQFRNSDVETTIKLWSKVRKGEEENIFRFQENADHHFNTFLPYELNVLKTLAKPQLEKIKENSPYYSDAFHLLNLLRYFEDIEKEYVPTYSILREFIGK